MRIRAESSPAPSLVKPFFETSLVDWKQLAAGDVGEGTFGKLCADSYLNVVGASRHTHTQVQSKRQRMRRFSCALLFALISGPDYGSRCGRPTHH